MNLVQAAILVEGPTEQAFVSGVLAPHLEPHGVFAQPVVVQTSRSPAGFKHAGGGRWSHYKRDIRSLLAATHYAMVTTMIDFYGYPRDAPGVDCCSGPHVPRECVARRVDAMEDEIGHRRFAAHVVLHEFEAMVFGAAVGMARVLGSESVADALRAEAAVVGDDVELLDDGPETAPSKRLKSRWPAYNKVTDGVAVIEEAGLDAVMGACQGLSMWVHGLESLGSRIQPGAPE